MLNAIKALIGKLNRKPVNPAIAAPKSRQHIRVTHWAHHCTIAYYGENGRKLTRRKVKPSDIGRLIKQAQANGYRAINF